MSVVIPGVLITAVFLMATWAVFGNLLDTAIGHSNALRDVNELGRDRLETRISISSGDYVTCQQRVHVYNGSQGASFADFSEVDLFVRYTASLGDVSLKRLTHSSEWRVASISGDAVNPKVWDPGETATIAFSLDQEPQTADKGTVSITVPGEARTRPISSPRSAGSTGGTIIPLPPWGTPLPSSC